MQQLVIEGRTWLDFSMLAIKLSTGHVINANLKNCFFSLPLSVSLQIKAEVTEDVYTSRKKQHQTMMHYFCALNTLQYKKKISLLEPLLGYMQAQVISDSESCRSQRRNKVLHEGWCTEIHCKPSSAVQGRKWRKRIIHPLLWAAPAVPWCAGS